VTEVNKLWNKGNHLRTYVTVAAAGVMLTVILSTCTAHFFMIPR